MVRANFSDVEEFEPLPADQYNLVIADAEIKESKAGNDYINWKVTVSEGEYEGRVLWFMSSLSPKAAWKLKEHLVALGEDGESLTSEFDFDPLDYIGTEFTAAVIQDNYEGKMKNVLDKLMPIGSGKPKTKAGRKIS